MIMKFSAKIILIFETARRSVYNFYNEEFALIGGKFSENCYRVRIYVILIQTKEELSY